MAKTTIAALEAQLAEQKAAFETTFVEQAAHIVALVGMIDGLNEAVAALNSRLNNAGQAFKELRADIVHLQTTRPVGRAPVKAQKPNLWFPALKQLREERGLHETAFVPREDVMARMQELAGEAQATEA